MRYLLLLLALSTFLGSQEEDFDLAKHLHSLGQHFQEFQALASGDHEYQLGKRPERKLNARKLLLSPPDGSFYRPTCPKTVSMEIITTYYPGLVRK